MSRGNARRARETTFWKSTRLIKRTVLSAIRRVEWALITWLDRSAAHLPFYKTAIGRGSLAGRRTTRFSESVSETTAPKAPKGHTGRERAILYARARVIQKAWPTGKLLRHDAICLDCSAHRTVVDIGLVRRCLCVESRQCHGFSPSAFTGRSRPLRWPCANA
jgi:hypothetical protein